MRYIPPEGGVETVSLEVLQQEMSKAYFDTCAPYKRQPFDTPEAFDRLHAAGIGLVDVIQNGVSEYGYYSIYGRTPQLRILDIICDYQDAEILSYGVVQMELRAIAQGTFDEVWGNWIDFFAGQQG